MNRGTGFPGTDVLTPRQRKNLVAFNDEEPTPSPTRDRQPLKGIGPRVAAVRRAEQREAGPNYLLKPLNQLRQWQRRGVADAWEHLVAVLPKGRFIVPTTQPHLGLPVLWAFEAIDDLATRGKSHKTNERLLSHYVADLDAKQQTAVAAIERDGPPGRTLLAGPDRRPPKPAAANVEAMIYGFNCAAAKQTVLEFGYAPTAWRRSLRLCAWRRCQRYFLPTGMSRTCRKTCAASLSRERKRPR